MKIRTDYVSNSSSSSFIIDFNDNGDCIDKTFMSLVKHVKGVIFSGTCESIEQLKELKEKANALIDNKIDDWSDEDDLYFSFFISAKYIMDKNATEQIDFIKRVLQLKNASMRCDCGDDFGSELTHAVQVATVLESKYKQIRIDGDDHLYYDSIRGTYLDI